MTLNNGLDKLGESMSVKKYLYREEQEVFDKIETTKKKYAAQKFTTKDAITFLINRGYEMDTSLINAGNGIILTPAPGITLVPCVPELTSTTLIPEVKT